MVAGLLQRDPHPDAAEAGPDDDDPGPRGHVMTIACGPAHSPGPAGRPQLREDAVRVVLGQHRRRPDDELVGFPDHRVVPAFVVELTEHVLDRLEPGPLLVVALDHRPRRHGRVGVVEHRFLGLGVRVPLVQRLDVHRAQLPLPHRVDPPDDEPGALLGGGHREPELGQVQPGTDQHVLELRGLPHELLVLLLRAEAHHPLHAGAVVPRAVEHDDLARRGQMRHVTLEVPLGPLPLARLDQRHDRRPARVQVLGEALDRAALAGRVAALEDDHDPLPGGLHPVLQLHQLDLERALEVLVLGPRHLLGVRVVLPPGIDDPAVRPAQHRVVVLVVVVDGQAGQEGGIGGPVGRQRVEVGGRFAAHVSSTAHSRCKVTTGPARGAPFLAAITIRPGAVQFRVSGCRGVLLPLRLSAAASGGYCPAHAGVDQRPPRCPPSLAGCRIRRRPP